MIATLADRAAADGIDVVIVTGDRDTYQLVHDPHIKVLYNRRGVSDYVLYDEAGIVERTGVTAGAVPRVRRAARRHERQPARACPGIGEKTAAKLVTTYGDARGDLRAPRRAAAEAAPEPGRVPGPGVPQPADVAAACATCDARRRSRRPRVRVRGTASRSGCCSTSSSSARCCRGCSRRSARRAAEPEADDARRRGRRAARRRPRCVERLARPSPRQASRTRWSRAGTARRSRARCARLGDRAPTTTRRVPRRRRCSPTTRRCAPRSRRWSARGRSAARRAPGQGADARARPVDVAHARTTTPR